MKKWVLLAAAAVLSACSVSSSQEGKHTGGIPVKVMEITKTENAGTRSYVGTASAAKSAYLFCRYPGRLVRLHVEKGDFVQAGDVIAEVESQSVISSWQISRSMLEQAEDGYRRARQVYDAGSMPDVKMVEVETKLAQARASADAAEAAMEDCRIKAPFSGVIGEVFVSEGVELDVIDRLVQLLDISTVEIDFPVPEKELSEIRTGEEAHVSVPALGGKNIPVRVKNKGITASPLSHTYECTASLLSPLEGLMPGMVVKVYVDGSSGEGITVPASVIRTDISGRYVWTVSENGIVDKKYVVTEGFSGQGVMISEGLSIGDKVIVEGVQKVCTGLKVRIVE